MPDLDIRPVTVDERRRASDTLRAALLSGPVNDENFAASLPSWDDSDSLAAWQGDRCVGHVAAFRFDSTVPGGAKVPTAGVTRVGVLPTHTRQGILTRLMHQLLVDSRERGQVIATLHASETPIYGRFGFGLGTDSVGALVTTRAAKPWRTSPAPGSMRLLTYDEVLDVVPELYEQVARWRVGSLSRPSWWWQRVLKEASRPVDTPFGKGSFVAVHSDAAGADDGFVLYDVDWNDAFATNPVGTGQVHDIWGTSPEVELDLWRYLLDIDLVVSWQAEVRPVDEPVRRAMHDARAYETRQVLDDQWVRLLDVDGALGARTFGHSSTSVRIEVRDPMFADNCGVWEISADGAVRVGNSADVSVDIATVSAAYLGAVSWRDLATIGAVNADRATLERLDALFAVRPAPFCGTGY